MALEKNRILELRLYKPHAVQKRMHESRARYRVAALGRQSGKSTWANNELAKLAWENPRTNYWFISPTFTQARVQFERFLDMFPVDSGIYRRKPHDGRLWLPIINGSNIYYKSGQVKHNLRGETLHRTIIDEMRDQPPELYKQVIRPMLATTGGGVDFLGTPNGFDLFWELAIKAQQDTEGKWDFFQSPSTCNPLFTQEEFEELKSEMSEGEFAQEILAEFREINRGSAYPSFGQSNQVLISPHARVAACVNGQDGGAVSSLETVVNPYLPIHLAADWNVTYMGWVLSQFRHGVGHYAFDEIYLERSHTQEAVDLFIHKFRSYEAELGKWRADPMVHIIGDSTGKSQKTSAGGATDFTILETALKKAGITFRNLTPTVNPLVKDRVNTLNARLKAADGSVNAWVNPKRCPKLTRDLQRVTWKLNASGAILDQTTDPSLTHLSDAWGYDICTTNPIDKVKDVGSLRIVRR